MAGQLRFPSYLFSPAEPMPASHSRSNRCETHFLGWDRPLLTTAAEWIGRELGTPSGSVDKTSGKSAPAARVWDLSDWLVVLPTGRSLRKLSQRLRRDANRRGEQWVPPKWLTVGELPEWLYPAPAGVSRIADETERTLAWTATLREADPAVLSVLFPAPPARDQFSPWVDLALTLGKLHEDVATANLDFAEVALRLGADPATAIEQQRFEALARLQADYLRRLATAERLDPSDARRQACREGRCAADKSILLVGTSDLNDLVTAMLRQASEQPQAKRLVSLIAAGPDQAESFDTFGTVVSAGWLTWQLPWRDAQLLAGDDVPDQAVAASECIHQWLGGDAKPADGATSDRSVDLSAGDITIGVTDESMVSAVEFELRQCGWESHRELGWTFAFTPIGRLIELLTAHLSQRTWQSLAALVRHADVHDRLELRLPAEFSGSNWLVSLDELLAEHYPTDLSTPLTAEMLTARPGSLGAAPAVAVADTVRELLGDFETREPQRLGHWARAIRHWIDEIYPANDSAETTSIHLADTGVLSAVERAERRAAEALLKTRRTLDTMTELVPALDLPISPTAALDLISGRLLGLRVGDPDRADAIQISGWLDLALDEAAALVVIGFNHPYVPDAVTADPFLPGSLRSQLGLADNERRLARDTYSTQLILATRSQTRFIVGRRGADGSPTPPTRLLAAAAPADVARRLIDLLDAQATQRRRAAAPNLTRRWDRGTDRTQLAIPKLAASAPIGQLSVTSFSAYLACPYRFFLRHVLQLKPLDDASRELAANQFGDLIHQSLEWFGNSDAKDETHPARIEEALLDALDRFATGHLGTSPAPAVRLQVEQARRRLIHVAKAQAARREAGWMIWKVEASVGEHNQAEIEVDGRRMIIRGRFDRIDRHPSGAWAILDYKTHGHPPRKKHLKRVGQGSYRWVDLQLPIYRLMIPYLVGQQVDPDSVSLGYFNIGDKESETRINAADFTATEFQQADAVIRECIRRIWAGDFTPSNDPVLYDDYAMILQSEIADAWLEPEPV